MLSAVALYSVACATAPAPTATPQAAPSQTVASHSADTAALRQELESAYDQIVARSEHRVAVPVADLEAAASIEIPQHRTVESSLKYFTTGLKDSIQTSLLRSARYRRAIDAALAEHKLPKGLAYLPVIESAYLPTLTSRAGAHGIWQFMPETAREYGLRVDWWVDERADPERSARAAAAFLKDLHRQFNDWPLVLAAYNAGAGRVKRALASTGATTFWELLEQSALPKETRGYVPTFFATLIIASDPSAYGFSMAEPVDPGERRVEVEGPVSLKYVAEVAGVDEKELLDLNPAYRRGILPPGRAAVRVPPQAAETVAQRARTLKDEDSHISVTSFTLRKGDSLQRLARAVGVKPEQILAMNDLRSQARVSAGDSIYLPVRARELGALLAHSEDRDVFYAVRKGDTLYSIAKRNGLSVADLREINELPKETTLRVGQKLRVSTPRTMTAGGM